VEDDTTDAPVFFCPGKPFAESWTAVNSLTVKRVMVKCRV